MICRWSYTKRCNSHLNSPPMARLSGWLKALLGLGIALSLTMLGQITPPDLAQASPSALAQTPPVANEIRGVWLTNVASGVFFSPWGVSRALRQLSRLNFNTVYPVVWNRGVTFYPSPVMKQTIGQSNHALLNWTHWGQDVLAEITQQGRRQQLRVIPWFEYGFMAPANAALVKRHPDWLTRRQDGSTQLNQTLLEPTPKLNSPPKLKRFIHSRLANQTVWLNPLHPDVQQLLLDLILEVVTQYEVDGIQLDDHFSWPVEFGYDDFTVKLYQQEHSGQSPPTNPANSSWMRWRAGKLSEFMQRIHQAVKAVKPNCIVSLSPNSQSFSYHHYLQDWQTWVQQGWVDELVLQAYRDNLDSFAAELVQPAIQQARRRIPVAIGILTGTWGSPIATEQIEQQVTVVRDRNFGGVSFFYWESLWGYITPESPQQRRQRFQALFSQPAIVGKP